MTGVEIANFSHWLRDSFFLAFTARAVRAVSGNAVRCWKKRCKPVVSDKLQGDLQAKIAYRVRTHFHRNARRVNWRRTEQGLADRRQYRQINR